LCIKLCCEDAEIHLFADLGAKFEPVNIELAEIGDFERMNDAVGEIINAL